MVTLFEQVVQELPKRYFGWRIQLDRVFKIEAGTKFDHVYTVTYFNNTILLADVVYKCDEKTPLKTNFVQMRCKTVDDLAIAIQDYIYRHEDDWNWGRTGIWEVKPTIETKPNIDGFIGYFVLK